MKGGCVSGRGSVQRLVTSWRSGRRPVADRHADGGSVADRHADGGSVTDRHAEGGYVAGSHAAAGSATGRHTRRESALTPPTARKLKRAVDLRSDRGSATVWSVGAIAVLCVVFGVVLALGQAIVTRHKAAGGADLAALAAADHWAEGGTAACARAERVARAQGVRLVRCEVEGEVSDVTAASGHGPFAAEVRARAGPADQPLPTEPEPPVPARTDRPTPAL
ncbi:Rv3654c family TadE-like protein [Streptomyces sp. NPDC051243]|uniref:Rv3654c family TadE-like protein n=1 Tax=Streptomyces sp. NPDC051243 TaxID=3365646 RepID=UPI0037957D5A